MGRRKENKVRYQLFLPVMRRDVVILRAPGLSR